MQTVCYPGWIGASIGDAIVDCRKPARVRITQIRHLKRCYAACQHAQLMAFGVAGQLHQDVDGVLTDHLLERLLGGATIQRQ